MISKVFLLVFLVLSVAVTMVTLVKTFNENGSIKKMDFFILLGTSVMTFIEAMNIKKNKKNEN